MANTERTLTNAELARKEAFEQARVELEAQGYRMHPLVISVVSANVGALATALPLDVVLGAGFFLLHPSEACPSSLSICCSRFWRSSC